MAVPAFLSRYFRSVPMAGPEDRPLTPDEEIELRKRALMDVSARTTRGTFAYALGWFIVAQGGDFFEQQRDFVLINLAGMVMLALLRFSLHLRFKPYLDRNFRQAVTVFRILVVCNGLMWGILLAVGMTWEAAQGIRPFITPVTAAVLMAGTLVMAIEPVLAVAFPVAVIAPAVIALLINIDSTNAVYAAAGVGFVVYAMAISRVLRNDYWGAQRARFLLEDRARTLEQVTLTDALTGIPNRLFLDQRLPVEWAEARRQRHPLGVAVVDLDHFKRINDTYGHPFGDLCLREAAAALKSELLRPSDVVARYGGEEFMVLMPNTDEQGARAVMDRMLERVRTISLAHGGRPVTLTCSIGLCVTTPADAEGTARLVQCADAALYHAKAQGRDRLTVFPYVTPLAS